MLENVKDNPYVSCCYILDFQNWYQMEGKL